MLRIDANMKAMLAEIARLGNAPNLSTIQRLESALQDSLNFSQGIVRVDTGSLRNSGVTESDLAPTGVWVGSLTYGGPSPGAVHDPVDYALQVVAYDAPSDWISVTAQTMAPLFFGAVALEFR
jgi:hypothetical protein